MFSSLTDRFFHGMNKRHTKMINTGQIKAVLDTSRSRRNSHSKSKTSRIFENTSIGSKRTSLNSTMRATAGTDFFKAERDSFVPPLPSNENEINSRRKRKYLSKTGSQFTPLLATQELHTLLQKHINKEQPQAQPDSQQSQKPFQLGSALSIKDKLRKKIESNAIKRYSNVHYMSGNTRSERVDETNIKQLLEILNGGHGQGHGQGEGEIARRQREERDEEVDGSQISSRIIEDKQVMVEKMKPVQPKNEAKNVKMPQKEQPPVKQVIQKGKKETIDMKQRQRIHPTEPISAGQLRTIQTQIRDKVPQTQKQIKTRKESIKIEKVVEQPIKQVPQVQNQPRKPNTFWNASMDDGFVTQVQDKGKKDSKIPEIPQKSKKTIQQKQPIQPTKPKTEPQPRQPLPKKPAQQKAPIKEKEVIAAKPITNTNTNLNVKQERKSAREDKIVIEDVDIDQIQEIQHVNVNVNAGRRKTEEKVEPKKAANVAEKVQKTEKTIKTQPKQKQQPPKAQPIAQPQPKSNPQPVLAPDSPSEQQYSFTQVTGQIQYIFYLINQIGNYCQTEKKFLSELKLQELAGLSRTTCYYLWQQFYYLKSRSIGILKRRDEDFYGVGAGILGAREFREFLEQEVEKEREEIVKVRKAIERAYEAAEPYLPEADRPLKIDPSTNYLKKCQKSLQHQFLQLQKLYRKAVKSSDKAQQKYIKRLCQIIQTFCQLKFLNNEQTKQYIESGEIENYTAHYQNYKHLVVL